MQPELLLTKLKELNLLGMHGYLQEHLLTHDEQPLQDVALWQSCLAAESAHRQARSLAYRLELARLPQIKQLVEFDTSQTPIKPELIEILAAGHYIHAHHNICLIGGTGTGKTHLAIGLAYAAIQQGHRVRFYKFNQLARLLLKAQEHRYELNLMANLQRFDVLVIDEMGYVSIEPKATSLLFELFGNLYERTSLIVTTHLNFQEWGDLFGSAKATKGIIDRLTHHCKVIDTGQQSWRLKEGKTMN